MPHFKQVFMGTPKKMPHIAQVFRGGEAELGWGCLFDSYYLFLFYGGSYDLTYCYILANIIVWN